jgi:hypothetical protein
MEYHIVYWRDIPAQVIVKQGRKTVRRKLPEYFEQAIDAIAMRMNLKDSDSYLEQWRRGDPVPSDVTDPEALADEVTESILNQFTPEILKEKVKSAGG